ncbi:unnamed protein product [Peronospora belbahrii]|uniref:Transmembrane protein n=1 Tax=Peronospora belbahrii TaxID=622444 RepID=A0AAU9KVG0_9STRA|nr:unnamed protein product [Peronospora belbahrii]CAH0516072.1 unnamed protein product [Peronospora belbahrii]
MSSYTDDAFECESPHAILASSSGLRPEQRSDVPAGSSSYVVMDNIDRQCMDNVSDKDNYDDMVYKDLAQPRPEIILRWKRFTVLVVLLAAVMSTVAVWLREGFVVDKGVPVSKAENEADTVNSYIGLMMGFIESIVGLGVEEIFPVFIVYLHNLRWYPGDDPATKKQSKFKKFALTIFIPAVMMAVGASLSAVQANQKDDNAQSSPSIVSSATTTRFLMEEQNEFSNSGLGNTILKTALIRKVEPMPPLEQSRCSYDEADQFLAEALRAAAPKAVFGFPLKEWSLEFGNGWLRGETLKHYGISQTVGENVDRVVQPHDAMLLATAHELWLHGNSILLKSMQASSSSQKVMMPSSFDEFSSSVLKSLSDMDIPLAQTAALNISFTTLELSSLMRFEAMTLTVPLPSPKNASIVCGESNCALLQKHQLNHGLRLPRKQIGISQLHGNGSRSAKCDRISNAAFVYGFTVVTTVERAMLAPTRSLVLSFGRLSWRFDKSAYACESGADQEEGCQVLHHQLGDSNRRLVLPKHWLPAQLQTRRTGGWAVSLVQLLEPKIRQSFGQEASFATLDYLESWPLGRIRACSMAVDTYLQYVNSNHFYIGDDIVETMAASALLFIFQNARVLDSALGVMVQRRLVETTPRRVRVFLTNTKVGNICTWTGCGLLLLLTALVLVLPNERARLSPPRGGNARAERFVAVQTEQVYPNLIYKKRFLIGKTGEEIKFGEFAVESVGLHHEMDEDEQIYI